MYLFIFLIQTIDCIHGNYNEAEIYLFFLKLAFFLYWLVVFDAS